MRAIQPFGGVPCLLHPTKFTAKRLMTRTSQRHFKSSTPEKGTVSGSINLGDDASRASQASGIPKPSALARLSTWHIVRNIALGFVFTRPALFRLSMGLLGRIADPQSRFLYPENNPIVKALIRGTLYDHFCAGTNAREVSRTIARVKEMGYAGVIVCPSREIMAGRDTDTSERDRKTDADLVEEWKQTHLDTLRMIGEGDYMGMKYTGAGKAIFNALQQGQHQPPLELQRAIDILCKQATAQGSRLWIDAEEQLIQPTIDRWTVDFMRQYNSNGKPIISNTYQAYLKSCSARLEGHLRMAQAEGWTLGIKLVRGAYIASEIRELIHDTKPQTDEAYDSIASRIIRRDFPGFASSPNSPDVHIFLAGHNAVSITKATQVYTEAVKSGRRFSPTRWGQLQGMADEVSCWVLQQSEMMGSKIDVTTRGNRPALEVYKCLQWGTVGECMQFLLRRATENKGAAQRMAESLQQMRGELWRRFQRRTL